MSDNDACKIPHTDQERRHATLSQLQSMLPLSEPWDDWLARTGELPPDFATMPSQPELPELIPAHVRTDSDEAARYWDEHRTPLKDAFVHWWLGPSPPPPDRVHADTLHTRDEDGVSIRTVRLSFVPQSKATLSLELIVPPGDGPFPVLLTQQNHRAWALIAVRRGYIGCVYAGADDRDDTDSFAAEYPAFDWSRLTRRAWAASRCVDYLTTLPQIRPDQIAITGHSRNGKQALIATAFDERIAAVVASSPGAGGSLAARYCSEQQFGEGVESLTRQFPDWFHPRLRFFVGREHHLPVDMHQSVALAAPRPCLLSTALHDNCENAWAAQQTYLATQELYKVLGAPTRFHVLWRAGSHETTPTTIERYVDWLDTQFGRSQFAFPLSLPYPHDWDAWFQTSSDPPRTPPGTDNGKAVTEAEPEDRDVRGRSFEQTIRAMLGDAPPRAPGEVGSYGVETPATATLLGRLEPGDGIDKQQVIFGEYINADLYFPAGLLASGRKISAVVWLAPWPSSHGYRAAYRRGEQFYRTLARAGFVVCCFDHIGSGSRIEEATDFYQRHPRWSLLGKMVHDAQAAVDMLESLPYVRPDHIWSVGYRLGSLVGLHLGAIDHRLIGLAAVSPPASIRDDAGEAWRLSHRDMVLPQLGYYLKSERRLPYDTADLLGALAPRPVAVVSPQLDRDGARQSVATATAAAHKSYIDANAGDRIEQFMPETHDQFGPEIHDLVIEWLSRYAQEDYSPATHELSGREMQES